MAATICLVLLLAGSAFAQTTTRVSVSSAGVQGNGGSGTSSISADGRYVALQSNASNLVTGDTNNASDIFVYDRQTGTTTRVSVSSTGVQGNGGSDSPSISADGRYVAFRSFASNLVTGDTNGTGDIFVYDRQTGATTRVSVSSSGVQGDGTSYRPSISADGRCVAFDSLASNLVTGDTNNTWDAFVYDRQTGATTRVSVSSSGVQANSNSESASISADGRYVAFDSWASNLVTGDTNDWEDIFVYDRQTNTTTRVSVSSLGAQGNSNSDNSSSQVISADGRYVAFYSGASNLITGESGGGVFVHDRQTGATTRVDVPAPGVEGGGASFSPSISADGRHVAFISEATNLVTGDTNGTWDAFVHDRQTGATTRVSVSSSGVQGNGYSYSSSISADGRYVTFSSDASNLVTGDTNGCFDVFVATMPLAPSVSSLSPTRSLTAGGTTVIITGTNLSGATAVKFGGVAAKSFTVNSSTKITAVCPAMAAGKVDVTVTTPGGNTSPSGAANDFYYLLRLEQTDSRLAYVGAWSTYVNSIFSGGSYKCTHASGATVTIPFVGTRLDLIGTKGPLFGKVSISLDGRTPITVDLYNSSNVYRQRFYTSGALTSGYHWVRLSYTGTKNPSATNTYIGLDAVDVAGTLVSSTRFEQTDSHILWSSGWTPVSSPYYSGGSYRYSDTPGAYATLTFTGESISIVARRSSDFGMLNVTLDGGAPVTVDLYSSTTLFKQTVWSSGFFTPGVHTLKIERSGLKNASSTGYAVDLDAVDVYGSLQ